MAGHPEGQGQSFQEPSVTQRPEAGEWGRREGLLSQEGERRKEERGGERAKSNPTWSSEEKGAEEAARWIRPLSPAPWGPRAPRLQRRAGEYLRSEGGG